jgi:hypothetical protein
MGNLVGLLINATGWSERACRALATLGLVIALLGACAGVVLAVEHRGVAKYQEKQEARARPATERAEAERSSDVVTQAKTEQEMHDVVVAAPDQAIAPSSLARACLQLRRAGKRAPPACRSASGH